MDIKEFYDVADGDYESVLKRLGTDDRISKFVKMFFCTGDIENLEKAIDANDGNNAFEFAHRLKGNSLNIGFSQFSKLTEDLVEPLRCREITEPEKINSLFDSVKNEFVKLKKYSLELA